MNSADNTVFARKREAVGGVCRQPASMNGARGGFLV